MEKGCCLVPGFLLMKLFLAMAFTKFKYFAISPLYGYNESVTKPIMSCYKSYIH